MEIPLQNNILPFTYELPSSVPTMPQNNPWSYPGRVPNSFVKFRDNNDNTMGKKATKGKIRMNKRKLPLVGFEPRLSNQT